MISRTTASRPVIREVWVRRDDGGIECKPWLIFEVSLVESAQARIARFLTSEFDRTKSYDSNHPSPEQLKESAASYCDIETTLYSVPPRLLPLSSDVLEGLPTELIRERWFTLGDSVGGISRDKPSSHNATLGDHISSESQDILFSPGLLCRIPILWNGSTHYIFQLAEKNLRTKGQIFYKPIGGHLKHTSPFQEYIRKFNLKLKGSAMPQDVGDVAFFVSPNYFEELRNLFLEEIVKEKSQFFVNPKLILAEELLEELGPKNASDGISLLSEKEVSISDL